MIGQNEKKMRVSFVHVSSLANDKKAQEVHEAHLLFGVFPFFQLPSLQGIALQFDFVRFCVVLLLRQVFLIERYKENK
jgi:hypothetical protein